MDLYWGKLLDIYNSLPEGDVVSRWKQAYQRMQEQLGTYREPGFPPTFDPPAQTPQEFASQYTEAITHMMATHASHLELPKHFMEDWRWCQAESRARKEG